MIALAAASSAAPRRRNWVSGLLALGDVLKCYGQQTFRIIRGERGDRPDDINHLAILVAKAGFDGTLSMRPQLAVLFAANPLKFLFRWVELAGGAADQFLLPVAGDVAYRRIDINKHPLCRHHAYADRRGLENAVYPEFAGGETLLCFPQLAFKQVQGFAQFSPGLPCCFLASGSPFTSPVFTLGSCIQLFCFLTGMT